jgi:hypothetical protein
MDIIAILRYETALVLIEIAGKESTLHRKYNIYLDLVTVATAPENYESRLIVLYPGLWHYLRLWVLEPHDLALTSLERNFVRKRSGVQHSARSGDLQAPTLLERYHQETRPDVIGNVSWHDQTLAMWAAAFLGDSGEST